MRDVRLYSPLRDRAQLYGGFVSREKRGKIGETRFKHFNPGYGIESSGDLKFLKTRPVRTYSSVCVCKHDAVIGVRSTNDFCRFKRQGSDVCKKYNRTAFHQK